MRYVVDSILHQVLFDVIRILPTTESINYTLAIQASYVVNEVIQNGVSPMNMQDEIIAGIELAWPAVETDANWSQITEQSAFDKLIIETRIVGEKVLEQYSLNGEMREFSYLSDVSSMARVEPANDPREDDFDVVVLRQKAIDELTEWDYLVALENSLNNNVEGEFLVSLVANNDFITWLV